MYSSGCVYGPPRTVFSIRTPTGALFRYQVSVNENDIETAKAYMDDMPVRSDTMAYRIHSAVLLEPLIVAPVIGLLREDVKIEQSFNRREGYATLLKRVTHMVSAVFFDENDPSYLQNMVAAADSRSLLMQLMNHPEVRRMKF
jgi:hypothetical protein